MEIENICPNCCNAELKDGVCPKCSYVRPESTPASLALPVGTILQDRYFIGKVLGQGGFGITYMGYDPHVNLRVAIKEYYPKVFASRNVGTHNIYPFTGDNEKYFKKGLERFMKEAWKIAKFAGEPAVVKVSDSFKENETAYIVMEYVDGDSLKTVLEDMKQISEETALELIKPIIKTLAKMHEDGIIHRDIAPDNIMVERVRKTQEGKARLIDFGSAMEQEDDGNPKSTVVMVKHGFAPIEQYNPDRSGQGTWTDVYAICATLYNMIEGEVPVDAQARNKGEKLKEFTAPITYRTKRAILRGLELLPENRTRTMGDLLRDLRPGRQPEKNIFKRFIKTIKKHPKQAIGIAAAAVIVIAGGIIIPTLINPPAIDTVSYSETTTTETAPETAPASDTDTFWGTTQAAETTAPSNSDSDSMVIYPKAKSYTYTPPSYDGFTLYERVDYHDDGQIIAASHIIGNKYAGFTIDYIPNDYLIISYTQENSTFYSGIHPMAELTLTAKDYGQMYFGRSLNGAWYGDAYLFWDYSDPRCTWRTYSYKNAESEPDGTAYYYDGTNMFIQNYASGIINSKMELTETAEHRWNLTENGDLYFVNEGEYSGFAEDGKHEYFGFTDAEGWSYRGQYIDNLKEGLGVHVWDSGDVFIGHYENDTPTYGYYYAQDTKKSYFVKYIDGALTVIEEIVGIDIDFKSILG